MDFEAVKPHIAKLAEKYGLSLVVLFGSQATGHTHKKSDVDIGYLASRGFDYSEQFAITEELVRIFRHPDVELVNLNNVSPELKKQAADDAVILFDRTGSLFDAFSIHANRIYMETKPLRVYREKYLKDFLKTYAS